MTERWSDSLVLFHASRDARELRAALATTRVAYVVLVYDGRYFPFPVWELETKLGDAPGTVADALHLDTVSVKRKMQFGPSGTPTAVEDTAPPAPALPPRVMRGSDAAAAAAPAPVPETDERTDVLRHPSIQWATDGMDVRLLIDLKRIADDSGTESEGVRIGGLSENWGELPVHVQVMSTSLDFPDGGNEGIIYVRRNADSVPCRLRATARGGNNFDVIATFAYEGRFCGFARVNVGGPATPRSTVVIDDGATAPDLTVKIFHPERSGEGRFAWLLTPCQRFDGLPAKLYGEIDLGARPGDYAAALFQRLAGLVPGKHMNALRGIGESLWDRAPEVFRQTYWAMREARGDRFSIQFISDDPYIPWELMRPYRDKANEDLPLMAAQHPVARWIASYEGELRNRLPRGRIVTVAPQYKNGMLPGAQEEASCLEKQFKATRLPGTTSDVMRLLEDKLVGDAVGLVHFAGHGEFAVAAADQSRILLEDGSLYVHEVNTQQVILGAKHRTLVVLNACEVGATGAVLGTVGGWAEAFSRRKFGGLVAPLWAVIDDDAARVIAELVDLVRERRMTVGEALTRVRAKYGEDSPTFFSYVFYGDVTARVAPA